MKISDPADWSYNWSPDNTQVMAAHSVEFSEETEYTSITQEPLPSSTQTAKTTHKVQKFHPSGFYLENQHSKSISDIC